ncbi:MAG: gamma-glutamyl-gamma-aminobutyrate hydrolase family protein [bacterium]|nr:gamma-glutamyl-gamma-aminobutyrate hydrolase family protein [bacterium]
MRSKPVVAVTTWERDMRAVPMLEDRIHSVDHLYTRAVREAGALPMLVGRMKPEEAGTMLDRVDGVVITGGPDLDPELYEQEITASVEVNRKNDDRDIALILEAKRRDMPLLGICRGLQAVNVALGGELHQHCLSEGHPYHPDLSSDDEERAAFRHEVRLTPDSRLRALYGADKRWVNSLHHQSISRLADGLEVVAKTPDGEIEAVESTEKWPMLSVQWHPERMKPEAEQPLFKGFVDDAVAYSLRT